MKLRREVLLTLTASLVAGAVIIMPEMILAGAAHNCSCPENVPTTTP